MDVLKRKQFSAILVTAVLILNLILGINYGLAAEESRITSVNSFDKFDFNQIQQTQDGGFIMSGAKGLLKVDSQMTKQWSLENPPVLQPVITYCIEETDDGYVMVETNIETVLSRVYLVKVDKSGQIAWRKDLSIGDFNCYGASCQKTVDGGYIVLGTIVKSGNNSDIYIIKTDAEGNKVWEKNFGGAANESGTSVLQTKDGGYVVAGNLNSGNKQKSDIYLIKTDSLGKIEWEHTYGGAENDSLKAILEMQDGFILTGKKGTGEYTGDIYLIRTDINGKALWENTYGQKQTDEWGNKVIKANDGGFLVMGQKYKMMYPDVYLVKVDPEGNKQWDKHISSAPGSATTGRAIFQKDNGDYLLVASKGISGAAYVNVRNMVINISNNKGSNDVKVLVNGKPIKSDVSPVIIGGRTFLPVRAISEALGATVTWRQLDKTVVITKKNRAVELRIDSLEAIVAENEQPKEAELDAPPFIVNGRTLVPVRFISEFFGAKVNWDGMKRTVELKNF